MVDQGIDALYEGAPAGFTAARDALAKRLKANGDAEASARVKELRRPTAMAYVLNQLARRHPDDLAGLGYDRAPAILRRDRSCFEIEQQPLIGKSIDADKPLRA